MATRNLSARQPAKNIIPNPPTRKVMGPDGVMITEKLSPIPFNRKMVSPDGDVVVIGLATGFTIRSFKGNDYGVQLWEEKLKAGFIPFDECPVAKGHVQMSGEAGCKGSDGRGQFSNQECCPHLNVIITNRREAHRKTQKEYGQNFLTNQDKLIAHLEAQAERMAIAERPGPAPGKKATLPGG